MKRGVIIAAVFALLVVGWCPADEAAAETLKGRIWAQWAENPDGEVLFGIQYWNTGAPGSGTPGGRTSAMTPEVPDCWAAGVLWPVHTGTENVAPYSGRYHAQASVRFAVKDKSLMD